MDERTGEQQAQDQRATDRDPSVRGTTVQGRTLVVAVDGLDDHDLVDGPLSAPGSPLADAFLHDAVPLRIRPGGPSEPTPALASLMTGATVGHTGVPTELAFDPAEPAVGGVWYDQDLRIPTLMDLAHSRGAVACALQWPATAGADLDLSLPLVENLRRYRDRWSMAEQTSSPRMVAEHLRPRRESGLHLSQIEPDALVAQIARDSFNSGPVDLAMVRLTGLNRARRGQGRTSTAAGRAMAATLEALETITGSFAATPADRILLVPGRPLVPVELLVHPNTMLQRHGLVRTDGPRLVGFRALVWPDGPRGALHVRRGESSAVRDAAMEALAEVAAHFRLRLRPVEDGIGATEQTDVIAVLEGTPGTVFGLSPTHRPIVEGDDPYYAGPRAVSDPSASTTVLGRGTGLPSSETEGGWADLGVTLAGALGITLPAATAEGMRPVALAGA